MGWNTGWTIMEEQIMALYEQGVLTPNVLKAVMRPFYGTDVDEGGSSYPTSSDGKSFYEIVVTTMLPDYQDDQDLDEGYPFSDKFYDLLETRKMWFDNDN